jgi:hypothetical protein
MSETSEEFPESWYGLADPTRSGWRVLAFLAQLRALRMDLDAPLRVLDVGDGSGALRA